MCAPFSYDYTNATLVAEHDYRNAILHALLKNDNVFTIIPIAHGLYSQWDAHVEGSKIVSYAGFDCTHWCYPSGVFKFVQRMVYNYIVRL